MRKTAATFWVALLVVAGIGSATSAEADDPKQLSGSVSISAFSSAGGTQVGQGLFVQSSFTDAGTGATVYPSTTITWSRNGITVPPSNSPFHVISADDSDSTLTATVVASASYGYAGKTFTATYSVPMIALIAGQVQLTGDGIPGSSFTAVDPSFTPAATSVTYQWRRDGADIAGATGRSLSLGYDDASSQFTVVVTGHRDHFVSTSVTSYSGYARSPFETGEVRVVGLAAVGSSLSTRVTGVTTPPGTTYSYRWFADGRPVGSGETYKPQAADVGKRIGATVSISIGRASTARSTGTLLVVPTTPAAPKAKIAGSATVGKTLVAKPGTWAPGGMKFTYQWYAGNLPIKGATKAKLRLGAAQAGKSVVVRITGAKDGYRSLVTISKATKKVQN